MYLYGVLPNQTSACFTLLARGERESNSDVNIQYQYHYSIECPLLDEMFPPIFNKPQLSPPFCSSSSVFQPSQHYSTTGASSWTLDQFNFSVINQFCFLPTRIFPLSLTHYGIQGSRKHDRFPCHVQTAFQKYTECQQRYCGQAHDGYNHNQAWWTRVAHQHSRLGFQQWPGRKGPSWRASDPSKKTHPRAIEVLASWFPDKPFTVIAHWLTLLD